MNKIINIQGQDVVDDGEIYHIHIKKPIYGTCVSINSKILKQAYDLGRLIEVSCPHNGVIASELTSPVEWQAKSKRFEKVYKFKNKPMLFFQASIEDNNSQLELI